MDDITNQDATGNGRSISDVAGNVQDKVADLSRQAVEGINSSRSTAAAALGTTATRVHAGADQFASAAHAAANKMQTTADYVRDTDLKTMGSDVTDFAKRYPGQALAIAGVFGFVLARLLSRNDR
jgi:ElaB/YqjD/DUF883 family membrane-anchored ribosome-binding protein